MRVFLALEMDREPREHLAKRVLELQSRISGGRVGWVVPENLHITLRFLGELSEDRVAEVRQAVESISYGACPFEPSRWGAFPDAKRPRVLWAGCSPEQEQQVAGLAEMVEFRLHSIGIHREPKPFRAHVTVGRVKEPVRGVAEAFEASPLRGIGLSSGESFVLMESRLGPGGSKYTALARFALGKE
ncbi:MAG: RNA 2',3'-cyclic phosphodiesterase [Fimbriimonadia bacterium]|jgi:2'-5' RNA ligase